MNNYIFLKFSLFVFIICSWSGLSLAELSCTINKRTHNNLRITDLIYDTEELTIIPNTSTYDDNEDPVYYLQTENVIEIDQDTGNPFVRATMENNFISMKFFQINETKEMSRESEFYYNFVIKMYCHNGDVVNMYTTAPLVDTNNHEPFFNKPKYTYNLMSPYMEDFKRQQFLNPIIATDYDVTNGRLHFTIEENQYFKIEYNGIVPGTLNKNHYAQIVPKIPGADITRRIELRITVTDMGYPPRSNDSKLVINPPSPSTPTFTKPFYVGHYYKNHTFIMNDNPQLQEGCTYYLTRVDILIESNINPFFYTELIGDEIIIRKNNWNIVSNFYELNYIAFELKGIYTDPKTELFSTGSATFIVELHHDL